MPSRPDEYMEDRYRRTSVPCIALGVPMAIAGAVAYSLCDPDKRLDAAEAVGLLTLPLGLLLVLGGLLLRWLARLSAAGRRDYEDWEQDRD